MTGESLVAQAVVACQDHDADQLRALLHEGGRHLSKQEAMRLFREELPLHLGPKDLTWLLRQITTDEAGFNACRDQLLDALTGDLIRNGLTPGRDFSIAPDPYVGRRLCLSRQLWAEVQAGISERSVQHYRCFIRLARPRQEVR